MKHVAWRSSSSTPRRRYVLKLADGRRTTLASVAGRRTRKRKDEQCRRRHRAACSRSCVSSPIRTTAAPAVHAVAHPHPAPHARLDECRHRNRQEHLQDAGPVRHRRQHRPDGPGSHVLRTRRNGNGHASVLPGHRRGRSVRSCRCPSSPAWRRDRHVVDFRLAGSRQVTGSAVRLWAPRGCSPFPYNDFQIVCGIPRTLGKGDHHASSRDPASCASCCSASCC